MEDVTCGNCNCSHNTANDVNDAKAAVVPTSMPKSPSKIQPSSQGILINKYKLTKELLGKGSFSKVYKGIILETGQVVAIKKMQIDKVKHNRHLQGEIDIMKALNHCNIVNLVDIIAAETHLFLVLEYCECGDLKRFLRRRPLKEKVARYMTKQLANGLRYLRSKNIIHRDLKPGNILIKNQNRQKIIKIGDFGFAKIIGNESLAETVCGTPLYMAPEIVKNKKYTDKADLWSTGIILYEMLFGKHPFRKVSGIWELMEKIEKSPIHFPSSIRISSECKDLLCRLLQKDPRHRIDWEDFFHHSWLRSSKSETSKNFSRPNLSQFEHSIHASAIFSKSDSDLIMTIRPIKKVVLDEEDVNDDSERGERSERSESPQDNSNAQESEEDIVVCVPNRPQNLPKSNPIEIPKGSKTDASSQIPATTPMSINSPPFLTIVDDYYDEQASFKRSIAAQSEPALFRKHYKKLSEEDSREKSRKNNSGNISSGSSSISRKFRGYMSTSYDLLKDSFKGFF